MKHEHVHLPIKVVIPSEDDLHPPRPGRPSPLSFTNHCNRIRPVLKRDVESMAEYFEPVFSKTNLPAVARVTLRDDAFAKSHRPDYLFERTCPIIGGENFGELLVSVRPAGVRQLKTTIETANNDRVKNDLGKIVAIKPYTSSDVLCDWTVEQFLRMVEEEGLDEVKVRLFTHRNAEVDAALEAGLGQLVRGHNQPGPLALTQYGKGLRLYRMKLVDKALVSELAHYVGAQSVSVFQRFTVSKQSRPLAPATQADLPPPESKRNYPVVGLIDSGTDKKNKHLQAWVVDRDEVDVTPADQDNEHGSLVAGLLVNGRALNHGNEAFPEGKVKIVDVVAFPSTPLYEYALLDTLHRIFTKYPDVKIWNMSFNSGDTCRTERFSSFAIAMDAIQDQYGVTVVNTAGNLEDTPLHPWRRPELHQQDRILSPADSLRAITVGSQAHATRADACAAAGEPSPFTRKGPGAAFVPKPEVSHCGGNCNPMLDYMQIGVVSVDGDGNRAETIGTSFAAPLVTATAAHIAHELAEVPSRNLLKALIVHSAVLHSPPIEREDLPYLGFGKPPPPELILRCRPWEATLIFEFDLPYAKRHFRKLHFPIPPCLQKDGKVSAEVTMTLVYDPPVDPSDGAAYSQVNINASLGTCWLKNGKAEHYGRQIIPYPKGYEDLFEKNMIEHGYKWSAVKVFRRQMKWIASRDSWRIGLEMHARRPNAKPKKQPVVLIATITDFKKEQPVYDEVVGMMNTFGWVTQNLQLRAPTRVRIQ